MLPDGRYSAYFQANDQDGMGVIELNAGRLTGGDTIISYFGTYSQDGDRFTASIRTERHSSGHAALFGHDNVDISVTGTSKDSTGAGTGHVKQLPGAIFQVVLVRMPE